MRGKVLIVLLLSVSMAFACGKPQPIRVGLLLPLQAEVTQRDKNMNRFADFYTGSLLAVYEMQEMGQKVEVYTWDVGKSVTELEQVLMQDTLATMDMIIGPVYPAQVREMDEWVRKNQVKTLLPFVYEVPEIETNPYLFQFNPSEEEEARVMVKHFSEMEDSVRLVFVEADERVIPSSIKALWRCIQDEGIAYGYTSVKQIMADSLSEELMDSVENILVLNTERFGNVRQVMPNIVRAAQGKQLTLMSRYSWQDEPIILPQIYTTIFKGEVDVDSVGYGMLYHRFVQQKRVETCPSYDLLGYDMMRYVLETVKRLREVKDELEQEEVLCRWYEGLQSDIQFMRVSEQGGYSNQQIQVVHKK